MADEEDGAVSSKQGFKAGMAIFAAGILIMFLSITVGIILLIVW